MLFKATVNWLSNDMWCYLIIGFFDWKIGVFQQTVVRVYCILNRKSKCDSNATQKDKYIKVKVALSLQEAMDIIKHHETENTVIFSIYLSIK